MLCTNRQIYIVEVVWTSSEVPLKKGVGATTLMVSGSCTLVGSSKSGRSRYLVISSPEQTSRNFYSPY